ncbi:MAG: hypothetical protein QM770_06170 [Tepidisphaeraceae bacterium]
MLGTLPYPSRERVAEVIEQYQHDPLLQSTIRGMAWLRATHPANTDIDTIAAKAAMVDAFYVTHVNTSPISYADIARRVIEVQFDERIRREPVDLLLIDELAELRNPSATRRLFSFATKFAAAHEPARYMIYDSQVVRFLIQARAQFGFAEFRSAELIDKPTYALFSSVVEQFASHFGLGSFGPGDLDKYMWREGRNLSRTADATPE